MAMRCAITGQLPLAHQGSGMPFIQAPDQRNRYGYPVTPRLQTYDGLAA